MQYNYILSNYKFDLVLDVNRTLFDYGVLRILPPKTVYGVHICDPPKALSACLKQSNERKEMEAEMDILICIVENKEDRKRIYPLCFQ